VEPPAVVHAETAVAASEGAEVEAAATAGETGAGPSPTAVETVKASSRSVEVEKEPRDVKRKGKVAEKPEAKKTASTGSKAAKPARAAKK
jgi:hypothetical protein